MLIPGTAGRLISINKRTPSVRDAIRTAPWRRLHYSVCPTNHPLRVYLVGQRAMVLGASQSVVVLNARGRSELELV